MCAESVNLKRAMWGRDVKKNHKLSGFLPTSTHPSLMSYRELAEDEGKFWVLSWSASFNMQWERMYLLTF